MSQNNMRPHRPERISLDPHALERVDGWMIQIQGQLMGTKVSRSQMVSYILSTLKKDLTPAQINKFKKRFFDEEKALLWAANKIKASKKDGEQLEVRDLIGKILKKSTSKN